MKRSLSEALALVVGSVLAGCSDSGSGPSQTTHGGGRGDAGVSAPASDTSECESTSLLWKSGAKTNYESYPAPGSEECVLYSGCDYQGRFQACANTMPESWVKTHAIASVFPLAGLELHRLCVRAGSKTIIVTPSTPAQTRTAMAAAPRIGAVPTH